MIFLPVKVNNFLRCIHSNVHLNVSCFLCFSKGDFIKEMKFYCSLLFYIESLFHQAFHTSAHSFFLLIMSYLLTYLLTCLRLLLLMEHRPTYNVNCSQKTNQKFNWWTSIIIRVFLVFFQIMTIITTRIISEYLTF